MDSREAVKANEALSLINQARVILIRDKSGVVSYLDQAADKINELITGYNQPKERERNHGRTQFGY